jgi:hypothetical protein
VSSAAITTIVKMVESLPDDLQEQVSEYIADLEDGAKWESSFERTRPNLVAAARKAKQEIAEGKLVPMDYGRV